MSVGDVVYAAYARRVARQLKPAGIPRHVGVMLDGNRRWAKERGGSTAQGHQAGADNIANLLSWCEEIGVEVVTLWLLSTDNLARPAGELRPLLGIIERAVTDLADAGRWRIHPVGALDLLPVETAQVLKAAADSTRDVDGMLVNVAVGYGGRQEIVDAVRALLGKELANGATSEQMIDAVTIDGISENLYTSGQPDPDLVIRTSGEQRLSGFLLWQSAYSEMWFTEAHWPAFRRVDFLRALRDYSRRHRRFGA